MVAAGRRNNAAVNRSVPANVSSHAKGANYRSYKTIKNGVLLTEPEGPIKQAANALQHKITHRDYNGVFPLKLGNVFVSSDHLGAVQGPKSAHHFDGALRRVGHLPPFTKTDSTMK